jgi:hypothetical protein
MERLAVQYASRAVRSVFVYTREAHPAENYRHHRSMEDKRQHARAFVEHCNVKRQVLLDDLSGTAHADVAGALEGVLEFQAKRAKLQWLGFYRSASPGARATCVSSRRDSSATGHRPWPITSG